MRTVRAGELEQAFVRFHAGAAEEDLATSQCVAAVSALREQLDERRLRVGRASAGQVIWVDQHLPVVDREYDRVTCLV
jgi:hypothetical protein